MLIDGVDETSLRSRLNEMKLEHRDLDVVISTFSAESKTNQIQLRRLKK